MRRGRKTANIIWGNSASVLVGDFLFSRSFELMVEAESLKVLKILSGASAVIAEGEVRQLASVTWSADLGGNSCIWKLLNAGYLKPLGHSYVYLGDTAIERGRASHSICHIVPRGASPSA